jgi:hypothetical protein
MGLRIGEGKVTKIFQKVAAAYTRIKQSQKTSSVPGAAAQKQSIKAPGRSHCRPRDGSAKSAQW